MPTDSKGEQPGAAANCSHPNFNASVDVSRIEDAATWYADLRLTCATCGQEMRFVGFPRGLSPGEPMVNLAETELRIPFRPYSKGEVKRRLLGDEQPGYRVVSLEGGQ